MSEREHRADGVQRAPSVGDSQEHIASLLGASESAAMSYVRDRKLAAHVVSRDGVGLPMKLGLLVGNLGRHVFDGHVVKVNVATTAS